MKLIFWQACAAYYDDHSVKNYMDQTDCNILWFSIIYALLLNMQSNHILTIQLFTDCYMLCGPTNRT